VDDAGGVSMGQGGAELGADLCDLPVRDRARGRQLAQVGALDELADEVGAAALLAELVEGDDAGMVEAGRRVRLAKDAAGSIALDRLDRDGAAEALVPGAVDGPVAAPADPLTDREPPKYPLAFDHGRVFATPRAPPAVLPPLTRPGAR